MLSHPPPLSGSRATWRWSPCPRPGVAAAMRDCGKAGIPFAIVLTAGFREAGAEGRKLEAELARAAKEVRRALHRPELPGRLSMPSRMWCVFGSVSHETELKEGAVSCAFQSGGFGYAVVNLAEAQGIGFRHVVSTGNETDIAMPELLSDFLDDPGTKLAFAYMEGTPDARKPARRRPQVARDRQAGSDLEGRADGSRHQGRRLPYRQPDRQLRSLPRRVPPVRHHRGARHRGDRRHRQAVRAGPHAEGPQPSACCRSPAAPASSSPIAP